MTADEKLRLDDEVGPGDAYFESVLDERAKELARDARVQGDDRAATHVAFEAGDVRFAIESKAVSRIVQNSKLTRIPGAPRGLEYVMHVDGAITSLTDPARFVADRTESSVRPSVLIVEHHGRRLGLFADRVTGLERIDPESITARSDAEETRSPVIGTTSSIVVVLDPAVLVSTGASS